MLKRENLREYQKRGVQFLRLKKHAGLFLDMGLGKTIITLTGISDLIARGEVKRVLLVAPLRPANGVWRQEARKWQHTRHLTFKLLTGNERQRLLGLQSQANVHIVNVDNLRWLLFVLKSRVRKNGWPYDMLVIDESSMFKTPKAKRFGSLRWQLHRFDRRVILTGTPAPKGLLDLWSQVFILDEGDRLGEQVGRFRSRFFSPSGYMGKKYEPDEGAEEKVLKLISPLILTMRAEDWLDLPPTLYQNIWVDLPPKARALYNRLEEEMFAELETGYVEITNPATLSAKCWQVANGALILDTESGGKTWQAVHDAKLGALEEIYDGRSSNMLVAYWFKSDLARLRSMFPKAPVLSEAKNAREQQRMEDSWNAGDHDVMLVHPQGTGHGLNLQVGGNWLVFFSMLWSREYYAQVIERIGAARQVALGRKSVMIKHILARDTVDATMLETQRQRYATERRIITALKEHREARDLLA